MSDKLGLKIGIEGEKEFKKALSDINQSFKVLGSEMKLATSQFAANDKSMQALSARNAVLNKEIDAQKQKIETLRSALKNASESFGENDRRTQNWQIQLNRAQAELNNMEREVKDNSQSISQLSSEQAKSSDAIGKLTQEISKQEDELKDLSRAYSNAVLEYGKNSAEAEELKAKIKQLSGELDKNKDALDDASDALDDTSDAMDDAADAADDAGERFEKFKGIAAGIGTALTAAVAAIGAAIGVAAKKINDCTEVYASFEDSMLQVAATMGITSEEIANGSEDYEKLTNAAKEAGATTRYSASEAGDALNYLALAGYDADKAVETLPKVLDLAAAGGMDLATTSDIVTDAMSALGLETSELDTFVDQLAKTSQKSNTSVQQLGEGLLVCAGTASSTGQDLTVVNAAVGILADNGLKSAEGGTKLRNILLSLSAPTDEAAGKLKELGVDVYDAEGNMRQLDNVMSDLNSSLGALSQEDRTNAINTIFNKTDIGAVNALLKGTSQSFLTVSDSLEAAGVDWEKYKDSAWYAADGVKGMTQDMIHSLDELGMSTEDLQQHLQLEYGLDADDALAAINSVSSSLEATVGDVDKISEALRQSDVDWEKYADSAWYAKGNIEGLTEEVLYCTTKLGQSSEEVQAYLQKEYSISAGDALAVIDTVNTSLEENGTRWQQLNGLIEDSTGAAAEMAGTMEAGLAGTTRSFNSAMEGMQIEIGGIFAGFKQTLMTDSIDVIRSFTKNLQDAGGDWGKIGEAIGQALGDIIVLINTYLPKVVDMGVQIIQSLGTALMDNQDALIDTATSILMTLLDTVISGLPQVMDTAVQLLLSLAAGIVDALPALAEAAVQIVVSLATGIADALPTLIPAVVQAVVSVVQTLFDNLPLILDAALQLVTGLAQGLLDAIPVLLQSIPKIVTSYMEYFKVFYPALIEAGIQLLTSIVSALPDIISAIVEVIPEIINGILTGLLEGLPQIMDAGIQLLTSLVAALPDIITGIVAVLPELITGIVNALMEFIPQIIDTGIQLLTSLVTALPDIITGVVAVLPELIDSLINALMEFLPQIIDAGVQLLVSLVEDLPTIISAILDAVPQIVNSLVNTLSTNIPKIIEAGVKLLTSLIKNLPSIISTIVKAVPQIIAGIVNTLKEGLPKIVEIGGNIVRGLWDGITQLADWLWNKVSGWISGIWDGICDFFGIHSPSREMAWVGEMLVKGLAGSIDDNGSQAVSAAKEMAGGVLDAFNDLSAGINSAFPDSLDFSVDTSSAVSATEKMAEDINGVFRDLSAELTSVLPSDFDINANANIAGALATAAQQTVISAPLFTVQQMIIRSEDDIRKVSQNLYDMIQTGSRAQGLFVLT